MTLKEKVQSFRNAARNILRLKMIANRFTSRFEVRKAKNNAEAELDAIKLEIATCNYEIAKLDNEHPKYAQKKEKLDESVKGLTEAAETVAKEIDAYDKSLAEIDEEISNIEKGEAKVNIESVDALVKEMIANMTVSTAAKATEDEDLDPTDN